MKLLLLFFSYMCTQTYTNKLCKKNFTVFYLSESNQIMFIRNSIHDSFTRFKYFMTNLQLAQ